MKQLTSVKPLSLIKLSGVASILLSNAVYSESYQSFSTIGFSHNEATLSIPLAYFHEKLSSDSLSLFSQYFFDEQQTLGPLNEFNYINSSSNVYASLNRSEIQSTYLYQTDGATLDNSSNSIDIGGEWITHDFLVGASYNYIKDKATYQGFSFDRDYDNYSASLGYFLLDDLVIRADYFYIGDEFNFFDDDNDYFSYSASYNLELSGTDYLGFTYTVDDEFEVHQLSSRYFFAVGNESYLVFGGDYTRDTSQYESDNWNVNSSYYFNIQTSLSVFYSKSEAYDVPDTYGLAANYFINNNYSIQAAYNVNDNDEYEFDQDGYSVSFSAQF